MMVTLHKLFCDQLPLCPATGVGRLFVNLGVVSWVSIEVHHWLGEFVLILAYVVRRRCEIERTAGEHILQIADEHTSVCGHKRS
jgi:hypothetical protein